MMTQSKEVLSIVHAYIYFDSYICILMSAECNKENLITMYHLKYYYLCEVLPRF